MIGPLMIVEFNGILEDYRFYTHKKKCTLTSNELLAIYLIADILDRSKLIYAQISC